MVKLVLKIIFKLLGQRTPEKGSRLLENRLSFPDNLTEKTKQIRSVRELIKTIKQGIQPLYVLMVDKTEMS